MKADLAIYTHVLGVPGQYYIECSFNVKPYINCISIVVPIETVSQIQSQFLYLIFTRDYHLIINCINLTDCQIK